MNYQGLNFFFFKVMKNYKSFNLREIKNEYDRKKMKDKFIIN